DPVLFELAYDYVGDLSETVALMWPPGDPAAAPKEELRLSSIITALAALGKAELPAQLARWLDRLDETGPWALLKRAARGFGSGGPRPPAKDGGGGARRQAPAGRRADLAGLAPALCQTVRLARGPQRHPLESRPRPVPPADARPRDRGRRSCRPRSEAIPRRM